MEKLEQIEQIIKTVGLKLADYDFVYRTVNDKKNFIHVEDKEVSPFYELSLSHGLPSLCILYGELSEHYPDEAWQSIGHEYIKRIGNLVATQGISELSMFSGGVGIGLATICMSHDGTRYKQFLNNIDEFLKEVIPLYVQQLKEKAELAMGDYDVIQGLCGIANYLLLDIEKWQGDLQSIGEYLVGICQDKEVDGQKVPGWYIAPEQYFLKRDQANWPNGFFNIGLSHGIPGILIVLCQMAKKGIHIEGQEACINKIVDFLMQFRIKDASGKYWGTIISMAEYQLGKVQNHNTRDAWCYGTPGVSYAMLVAGKYLGREEVVREAISAMQIATKRCQDIYSPTFCHGYSGIAYISKRFYDLTGEKVFKEEAERLSAKALTYYEETSPFGFSNLEEDENEIKAYDYIGIIDGVVGVLLATLAIYKEQKTPWHYAFCLQ